MSSTNKTELGLNQWILPDKPTMEDFNADNVLVDQLLGEKFSKEAAEAVLAEKADKSAVNNALLKKLDKSIISSGTWTPYLYGETEAGNPTYTTQQGHYYKLGNIVICRGSVAITNKGGMSGTLKIGGLPFSAITNMVQPFSNYRDVNLPAGRIIIGASVQGTFLSLIWGSNTWGGTVQASEINDNFLCWNFNATYATNL